MSAKKERSVASEDEWVMTSESIHPLDPIRLPGLILKANEHARQPIDLNYVAVSAEAWEELVRIAKHGR